MSHSYCSPLDIPNTPVRRGISSSEPYNEAYLQTGGQYHRVAFGNIRTYESFSQQRLIATQVSSDYKPYRPRLVTQFEFEC